LLLDVVGTAAFDLPLKSAAVLALFFAGGATSRARFCPTISMCLSGRVAHYTIRERIIIIIG